MKGIRNNKIIDALNNGQATFAFRGEILDSKIEDGIEVVTAFNVLAIDVVPFPASQSESIREEKTK